MRVVTVCTGNICRSPLIAQVLTARLAQLPAAQDGRLSIESAGTQGQPGQGMPEPAARSSLFLGGNPEGHAARYLSEGTLQGVSLVLTAEREHRARVVALSPAILRRTFTVREFARLAAHCDDATFAAAIDGPFVGAGAEARLGAMLGALADIRGMVPPPEDPAEDDVIDPYLRSERTFALAAEQMAPGIDAVARVLAMPALWQD